tara:strand:+ start:33 stop:188 length:156 start_codon:yes stop_codon:yes gene_type:complete
MYVLFLLQSIVHFLFANSALPALDEKMALTLKIENLFSVFGVFLSDPKKNK